MGFIELEQFALAGDVTTDAFGALDDRVQAWSYAHRVGLRRRTTAFGDDSTVLVVSVFSGSSAPGALGLDDEGQSPGAADDPVAALRQAIEPGTYGRTLYEDRG